MVSNQQMLQYPKKISKSWDRGDLRLNDAFRKYHKVEQLYPAPTWSDSHGNHDCKKISVAEAEVENMINRTKTLKGVRLQLQHNRGQTNLLLFPFPTHWLRNSRNQTWSFATWSAPTAYNQGNWQCLTLPLLHLGLGPGTTFMMRALFLLAADGNQST